MTLFYSDRVGLSMSSRRRAGVVIVSALAVVLLVGGCSSREIDYSEMDSNTTTSAKTYGRDADGLVESIADHFSAVGTNLNLWAPPRSQAKCAAEKMVATLGVDRLLELGFDPQKGRIALPFSDAEQTSVLNILVGCVDFKQGLLELISAYQKLDVTRTACVTASIDRQGLTRDLVASLLTAKESDPLAASNRVGVGVTLAMGDCLDNKLDLLPVPAEDPFPQDKRAQDEPSTTTTVAPTSNGG